MVGGQPPASSLAAMTASSICGALLGVVGGDRVRLSITRDAGRAGGGVTITQSRHA
jgi:hypothetical protein